MVHITTPTRVVRRRNWVHTLRDERNVTNNSRVRRGQQNAVMDVMLKIQRSTNGKVVFTLSGRIELEDVSELRQLLALETAGHHAVLDLRDVTLVDGDAIRFLARCEADGTQLENCPAYIREWIEREKDRKSRQKRVVTQRRSARRQTH